MANRFRSQAEIEGAKIWYSLSADLWWMDSTNPQKAAAKVRRFEDAIHVTNAYDVLSEDTIHKLITDAER